MATTEMDTGDRLLTPAEVCDLLQIRGRSQLYRLIELGLPRVVLSPGGRTVRFRESAVRAWIAERERVSRPAAPAGQGGESGPAAGATGHRRGRPRKGEVKAGGTLGRYGK